jgi:insertion element IS1 protein InsB
MHACFVRTSLECTSKTGSSHAPSILHAASVCRVFFWRHRTRLPLLASTMAKGSRVCTRENSQPAQWHSRYGASVACQHQHGDERTQKKAPALQPVNQALVQSLHPEQVEVEVCRSEELDHRRGLTSELDEMWSYVAQKSQPRSLWHAIDHHTGQVLAYVFGRRQDDVFLKRQQLLAPFGITRFYTDGWGAYERHLDPEQHQVGKEHTQKIESKHINLRTRIKRLMRRTICFSKTERMHDLVIGMFINRYEFGRLI